MPKTIISVDPGNKQIKTINFCFDSGLEEYGETPPPFQVEACFINGKYYSLSKRRTVYKRDKTVDDTYYILTLIGVAKELLLREKDKTSITSTVVLLTGLPPAHMKKQASEFAAYLKRDGKPVSFDYAGCHFEISVDDVKVFPQAYGAALTVYKDLNLYNAEEVYIIDIGGYTTDIVQFTSGTVNMEHYLSFEMGTIPLIAQIQKRINVELGSSPTERIVESLLMGNSVSGCDALEPIVTEESEKYAKKLLATINESGVELLFAVPIFTGGGAIMLEKQIKATGKGKLNSPVFIKDINANAKGFQRGMKLEIEKEQQEKENITPKQDRQIYPISRHPA